MQADIKYWGFAVPNQNQTHDLGLDPNLIGMSRSEMFLASCTNILRNTYGFMESVEIGAAVDHRGQPLPLYTYPAIEYLVQLDVGDKRVFEFGSGGSTIFWMKRAGEVVTVENNRDWCDKLSPQLNERVRLIYAEGDDFPRTIRDADGEFDVIIVDGAGYRYDCAAEAVAKLARGGLIVLDNSDWHPNTAALLKQSGLLQVDMTGFKPSYSHTSTTSLFFHREFDFPAIGDRQPAYGMGAKCLHSVEWDKPLLPADESAD
ncbi:MAG: O-methyltransferase [Gammaproteobacteria bacterium]